MNVDLLFLLIWGFFPHLTSTILQARRGDFCVLCPCLNRSWLMISTLQRPVTKSEEQILTWEVKDPHFSLEVCQPRLQAERRQGDG